MFTISDWLNKLQHIHIRALSLIIKNDAINEDKLSWKELHCFFSFSFLKKISIDMVRYVDKNVEKSWNLIYIRSCY